MYHKHPDISIVHISRMLVLDICTNQIIHPSKFHSREPGASAAAAGCHQPALEASSAAPPWGRQLVRIHKGSERDFRSFLGGSYRDATGIL